MKLSQKSEDVRRHKFEQNNVEQKVHPSQTATANQTRMLRDIRRMGRH